MKYSQFHRKTNPISAARLDEAFNASKMEGGPGDPVKVEVKKDKEAGKVTITRSSQGSNKKPLTDEEKKIANSNWANMTEEQKQASRDRATKRDEKNRKETSSYTFEKLPYHNAPKLELMEEPDIDFDFSKVPNDYTGKKLETDKSYTYTTSEVNKKTNNNKVKYQKIDGDGLSACSSEDPTKCIAPTGDQTKKELRGAKKKRKMEERASAKRDRKIERGWEFNPKAYFEERAEEKAINKARKDIKKQRAKKTNKSNRQYERSLKNTPIRDFFNDMSKNKKPKSRTVKASF